MSVRGATSAIAGASFLLTVIIIFILSASGVKLSAETTFGIAFVGIFGLPIATIIVISVATWLHDVIRRHSQEATEAKSSTAALK